MKDGLADRLCCEKTHSAESGRHQCFILGSEGRRFTASSALNSGCCRVVECVPAAGPRTSPPGKRG